MATSPHADALTGHIRGVLPTLPEAAGRVARVILASPHGAARLTIGDLARAAETSEGTVTRTVKALGFDSYSDFRITLATATGPNDPDTVVTGDLSPDDTLEDLVSKAAAIEVRTVRETAATVDHVVLGAVADAIVGASRVSLFGGASSGLVAADLHIKLIRIGLPASMNPDPQIAIAEASLLPTDGLAFAVSHSGESRDAIDHLTAARAAGATTVCLTGARHSTLSSMSDHTLVTAGGEDAFRSGRLSSRLGEMALVHILFLVVTQRTLATSSAALETSYRALGSRLSAKTR